MMALFVVLTILSQFVSASPHKVVLNSDTEPEFEPSGFGGPSFYNSVPDGGFAGPGLSNGFTGPGVRGRRGF